MLNELAAVEYYNQAEKGLTDGICVTPEGWTFWAQNGKVTRYIEPLEKNRVGSLV